MLRGGVGDRFEERLERGSEGGRAHPGGRILAGGLRLRIGEADNFSKRQVMQICAPCPNAWIMSALSVTE